MVSFILNSFKRYLLLYTLIPLLILLTASAYYRFMVLIDYTVSYEGECEPYTQSCFLYCEDQECAEPFYYSIIERNAAEVYALCGDDVTTCDDAYICEPETPCSVTYCDSKLNPDECEILNESDLQPNDNDTTI